MANPIKADAPEWKAARQRLLEVKETLAYSRHLLPGDVITYYESRWYDLNAAYEAGERTRALYDAIMAID